VQIEVLSEERFYQIQLQIQQAADKSEYIHILGLFKMALKYKEII